MTTKAERTAIAIDLVALVELMRRGTAAERSGNKVKAREYGRRRLALLGACDLQTQATLLNWALYALAGLTRQKQDQDRLYLLTLGQNLAELFEDGAPS